jgi:hypothetical protein
MTVDGVHVHPDIRTRLGDDCLREICGALWARDCQSCGRPFAGEAPSLCVGDLDGYAGEAAYVTLHHRNCRPSVWSPRVEVAPEISYLTQPLMLPDSFFGGGNQLRPAVLLNTSLETAGIHRTDGSWRVTRHLNRRLGLRPIADGYVVDRPVAAGSVSLRGADAVIRLGSGSWGIGTSENLLRGIRTLGGITLLVSSAYGGDLHADTEVLAIVSSPWTEAGWLPLRP